jgi:hypothetical protein
MLISSAGEMKQMYSIKQKPDLPFFLGPSNFSNQVLPVGAKKGFTFVPLFESLIMSTEVTVEVFCRELISD